MFSQYMICGQVKKLICQWKIKTSQTTARKEMEVINSIYIYIYLHIHIHTHAYILEREIARQIDRSAVTIITP